MIKNPYIRDRDKCLTPVYIPGESYSFYMNFDSPISDPNFANFRLDLYRYNSLYYPNVGPLNKQIVKGVSLYNIWSEFTFPSVPNGQYIFVIVDTVSGVEKCRSNVILCERGEFALVAQSFVFWHDENIHNYYYETLPNFKNKFRLPLALIEYQFESERTQYRNVSDNKIRNMAAYRDEVNKIESYNFDKGAHQAITAVYEKKSVYINNAGVIPKSSYQISQNQSSNLSKGTIDVYLSGKTLETVNETTYTMYYGPSNAIPTTEAAVLALNSDVFATQKILNTGSTQRFFSVAIRDDRSITSVTDLDAPLGFQDVTANYIYRSTILIDGFDYDIYTMVVGVPYLINHRHIITSI